MGYDRRPGAPNSAAFSPLVRTVPAVALGTTYLPSDLHMGIVARRRRVGEDTNLFTAAFDDSSTYSPNGYGAETLKILTTSGGGTVTASGGKYSYTAGGSGWNFQAQARIKLPCAVAQATLTIGAGTSHAAVGFSKSTADNFYAYLASGSTSIHLVRTVAGSQTDTAISTTTVVAGDSVRVVLNWPTIEVWYKSGAVGAAGWTRLGSLDVSAHALQTASELALWRPFIGESIGAGGTGAFVGFTVDIPGGTFGIRDPKVVTFDDGTPFIRDGRYFFAATVPDTAVSYQGNHMAIFSLDPVSYQTEHVSDLFFRPSSTTVAPLYAGQVIYDQAADVWRVICSDWGKDSGPSGTNPFPLWLAATDRDILRGVHLLAATALTLPGTYQQQLWDPAIRRDATGSWRLAAGQVTASANGTQPILFSSPDLTTWTKVVEEDTHNGEGAQWAQIGGAWYVLYAGTNTPFDFLCFDANLNYVGALSTWSAGFDTLPGYTGSDPGPSPHPCVIPVMDDDRTRYLLVTFDRTNVGGAKASTGALVVMEAAEMPTGHEFPRKHLLRAG